MLLLKKIALPARCRLAADGRLRPPAPLRTTCRSNHLSAGFEAWKAVTDGDGRVRQRRGRTRPGISHQTAGRLRGRAGAVSKSAGCPTAPSCRCSTSGTIRPLDDLVAAHGQHLGPNQLIKIDGKIMAISMMVNTQHLMYRKDILERSGYRGAGELGRRAGGGREDQGRPGWSITRSAATYESRLEPGPGIHQHVFGLRRHLRQRRQRPAGGQQSENGVKPRWR